MFQNIYLSAGKQFLDEHPLLLSWTGGGGCRSSGAGGHCCSCHCRNDWNIRLLLDGGCAADRPNGDGRGQTRWNTHKVPSVNEPRSRVDSTTRHQGLAHVGDGQQNLPDAGLRCYEQLLHDRNGAAVGRADGNGRGGGEGGALSGSRVDER